MYVLMIDDEVRKAQSIVAYCREVCGWKIELASGPDQALALLDGSAPRGYSIILLDIMMDPGSMMPRPLCDGGKGTGIVLIDYIVERTGGAIPIVVYTARTGLEYLSGEGRVAAYLQKPQPIRDLVRELERLAQGGK